MPIDIARVNDDKKQTTEKRGEHHSDSPQKRGTFPPPGLGISDRLDGQPLDATFDAILGEIFRNRRQIRLALVKW